jgi:hypothetical protein
MRKKIINYKSFELDEAANSFLQHRLMIKTPLSNLLKKNVNLVRGRCFTFLPEDTKPEQLHDFSSGGILPVDDSNTTYSHGMKMEEIPSTLDGLVNYIYNYLDKNTNNVLLLEDFLSEPEDKAIQKHTYKKVFIDNHVYYWFTSSDSKETITQAIKHCSSKPEAIGILSAVSHIGSNEDLEEKFLTELVKNMNVLFCEAYDHEGYILWEKN